MRYIASESVQLLAGSRLMESHNKLLRLIKVSLAVVELQLGGLFCPNLTYIIDDRTLKELFRLAVAWVLRLVT